MSEQRIIDPNTGGAKGQKLARFDLLPWSIIQELAEHFGRGARKYEDRNWEKGYKWSLSFGALHRHLDAFWRGEEYDDDASLYVEGEPRLARHIVAVVWHACVLAFFSKYGRGTDDRPLDDRPHMRASLGLQRRSSVGSQGVSGVGQPGRVDSDFPSTIR